MDISPTILRPNLEVERQAILRAYAKSLARMTFALPASDWAAEKRRLAAERDQQLRALEG